jgi:crotonobetainyl-CoA:carnitine CoA-transferase CaiB-like acyl-CoA transferase
VSGLLDGVRVVEAAVLLTGDYLGMLLGDEGADVIKMEAPPLGDYIRDHMGAIAPRHSPYHLYVNRNKRSVAVNLKSEGGQDVLRRLIAGADVFITGFTADTPTRLGMGYEQLQAIKPDIVYCQATGFGADGPYASIPTHGGMMNALVAAPPLHMGKDGRVVIGPDQSPQGVVVGPLFAAYAVAAALYRRERTGAPSYIDVACSDSVLAATWPTTMLGLNDDRLVRVAMPARQEEGGVQARYTYYETSDGKYVLFCPEEKRFWASFCHAVDRPDLIAKHDDSVVTDFGNDPELLDELQRIFHTRTQHQWVALCRQLHVPGAPALRLHELGDDPHLQARGMVVDAHHPIAGRFRTLGHPIRTGDFAAAGRLPAPTMGQHTNEVLSELGYGPTEISALRAAGVTSAVT